MSVEQAWVAGSPCHSPEDICSGLSPSPKVVELLFEGLAQNTSGSVFLSPHADSEPEVTGSPTEAALLRWALKAGMDFSAVRAASAVLDVEVFSTERKRTGVLLQGMGVCEGQVGAGSPSHHHHRVVCHWKGGADLLLAACSHWLDGQGQIQKMDDKAWMTWP